MTIRFSPSIHAMVRTEAEHEGVSMAEFVREAAFARAVWRKLQREGYHDLENVDEIVRRLRADLDLF